MGILGGGKLFRSLLFLRTGFSHKEEIYKHTIRYGLDFHFAHPTINTNMSCTNGETECHFTQQKSPWDIYNVQMKVNLDVWVAKATRKDSVGGVVAVRTFPKHGATIIEQRHKALHHTNLLATLEIYRPSPPEANTESEAKEHLFVVSEYAPFTLEHVRACARPPSDGQIAAIMGQVRLIYHSKIY